MQDMSKNKSITFMYKIYNTMPYYKNINYLCIEYSL